MRDPKPKNIPGSDLFPFRFRIHRLPEDREAVTCEEKEEQLLRQLKERGPKDAEKRPGEICRSRYGGERRGKNRRKGKGRSGIYKL